MYWSATGKSAYFSLTVLNDLKKWQINLWWQDQTRKKTNRRALYCIKYTPCTDAPAFADTQTDLNAYTGRHVQAGAYTHVRSDHKCCSVRQHRNERGHLMKERRIIDDISVLEPLPPYSKFHICYVDGQLTWDLGAGTSLSLRWCRAREATTHLIVSPWEELELLHEQPMV